ncbi:pyridoxamine 5'-phosphate oxidase [Pedobacter changchengzhani]|uniref:Pyridoxamine 5'-phosphate oxidase n=1 Tax=Pedobacter changchengzhani TaxID=2529274 RepID=A0A4R5MHF5_9SPHI|nr:pyridoxamine 5'-phosphate oxidase family protein [Pedobacter changchengzhani]TDG34977.1 pyridoxamine 5'-phosphate oxidase [Pedobacter changchengzhani]
MKNEKNISILKEMAESVRICMFTTFSTKDEFGSRPMGTAKIEDDGTIWFFTNEYSLKSKEVSKDNSVLLVYSDPSKNTYLTVKGDAELVDDRVRKESYFSPFIKAWFPDGIDDPRLILIKVVPHTAEYWDSSSSKIVVLFSTLKALVTGSTPDLGKHDTMSF